MLYSNLAPRLPLSSAHSAKQVPDDLSLSIVDFFFVRSVCLFVLVCFVESVGGISDEGLLKKPLHIFLLLVLIAAS